MSQELIMPKLGLTMTQGKISRWLKKEGDRVSAGEPVVEIETDKINSEVESPADGYILKILAAEGEERDITVPICIIGENGETDGPAPKTAAPADGISASVSGQRIFITPYAKKLAKENNIAYTDIKGSGPEGRIMKRDILQAVAGGFGKASVTGAERIRISPVAKKIADGKGLDYSAIKGTGPDGRIVKEDILAALETHEAPAEAASVEAKKMPLAGIRKVVAQRLSQSKRDIPHVYFKITVDASGMMELKNKLAEKIRARAGRKLTLNDIIVKGVASALEEFPDINVSLINDEIIYHDSVNIGLAVNSDRGLVVPVVRDAGKKSISEVCTAAGELVDKARAGKLAHDDITGGTFTISNLGPYYIDEFSAIINPPESAILAVGRAADTPCAIHGQVMIKPVMHLTLSVDHRVIDGALAAQFMKKIKELLEDPYLFLI